MIEILAQASATPWQSASNQGLAIMIAIAFLSTSLWIIKLYFSESSKREERMEAKNNALEEFNRTTLVELVKRSCIALESVRSSGKNEGQTT